MTTAAVDPDPWGIAVAARSADRVLKDEETFGVFDRSGDILGIGGGELGLYHEGTRFLSRFRLTLNGRRPVLLNSWIRSDNSLLVVDATTPDLYEGEREGERLAVPPDTLHLFRARFLQRGVMHEHIRLVHYGERPAPITLALEFDADFADIFEVRGNSRNRRGELQVPRYAADSIVLAYRGLDDVVRRTRITFDRPASSDGEGKAAFAVVLAPGRDYNLHLAVSCEVNGATAVTPPYAQALEARQREVAQQRAAIAGVTTSNVQFNAWIERSIADLDMLVTHTAQGPYPYAGVPWFSAPFGRDGIVTAIQMLWVYPALARGVLSFLAAHQADTLSAPQDAEPGKILHETRRGEMAALHEIPFGCYYGSVDSTPLFLVLAGEYFERTGDREFAAYLWPHVERALHWIDRHGDVDGDGFVEYRRRSPEGLQNQGWRDSADSLFDADGRFVEGPVALVEVQGYVFAGKLAAARLADVLGRGEHARALREQAANLAARFDQAFWCEELGTYALALDRDKRPCRVRSSCAGHALTTGIARPERAARVAQTLLEASSFNGWGVRTVASTEARYNPMSYHNGSLWPHDNALVAVGLARYGFRAGALAILRGLFDASRHVDLNRLPELFCGFDRQPGQGPTLYPVACSPQAWASGAVFHLLQACLGVRFSPVKPQIRFDHPVLPDDLDRIAISQLEVAGGSLDAVLMRHGSSVSLHVTRKQGDVDVAIRM